jgi:hypothetical protein
MKRRRLRLLLVSPHFPPVNAPDHQRVRLMLPHLRALGVEAVVLACAPDGSAEQSIDPFLLETIPPGVEIIRVPALPLRLTAWLGIRNTTLRSLPMLLAHGFRLLLARRFDLVYLSTTQFSAFLLGPIWRLMSGVPYVLDLQDPWRNEHYRRTGIAPPGGAKFHLEQLIRRLVEPLIFGLASGVTRVSPAYRCGLRVPVATIPFGASADDFRKAGTPTGQPPGTVWLSMGRGGRDLWPALRLLFAGLQRMRARQPDALHDLRLEFVGTSYAPAGSGEKTVEPLAREYSLQSIVAEYPDRVPYLEALQRQAGAAVLLVVGSDDPRYQASKLAATALAGRPFLVIAHAESPLYAAAMALPWGRVLTHGATEAEVDAVMDWLISNPSVQMEPSLLAAFDSGSMAKRLTRFFRYVAYKPHPRPCQPSDHQATSGS